MFSCATIQFSKKTEGRIIVKSMFAKGLAAGIPIALGYLSVSFGFGIMAVRAGLSVLAATGISLTNLTSAGQVAGVTVIAAGGTVIEMILTQLVINLRYSLMGISLTQKLSSGFSTPHRLACSFGITDEVFAVASTRDFEITPPFMYGLILLPLAGWTAGTLLGAVAGQLLPAAVSAAMGIVIYGMFIAIVVPQAKKEKSVLAACIVAIGVSCLFRYVLTGVSEGISVIISAVAASAAAALVFPLPAEKEEKGEAET